MNNLFYYSGEEPHLGDYVRLIDNHVLSAKKGTRAVVIDIIDDTEFGKIVTIKWASKIDSDYRNEQLDGNFNCYRFGLIERKQTTNTKKV